LPVVQVQPQQEEDREAREDELASDEGEEAPVYDEEKQQDGPQELVIDAESRAYRIIHSIRLNSKFYMDNLGF